MTTQQKDTITNRIMINISIGFAGTILWYVMYSLLKSSLYEIGYIILLIITLLSLASSIYLYIKAKTRKKLKNYAHMMLFIAICGLFMNMYYIFNLFGFGVPKFLSMFSAETIRYQVTIIGVWIAIVGICVYSWVSIKIKTQKEIKHKKK